MCVCVCVCEAFGVPFVAHTGLVIAASAAAATERSQSILISVIG